jgi:hypothetical protein
MGGATRRQPSLQQAAPKKTSKKEGEEEGEEDGMFAMDEDGEGNKAAKKDGGDDEMFKLEEEAGDDDDDDENDLTDIDVSRLILITPSRGTRNDRRSQARDVSRGSGVRCPPSAPPVRTRSPRAV